MTKNSKIFLCAFAVCLLGATTAAQAQLNVHIGGYVEPPVYVVQPAPPVYYKRYPNYYDPHHSNRDWKYWKERRKHDNRYHDKHDDRGRGHRH